MVTLVLADLTGLRVEYPGTVALRDVDLEVRAGTVSVIAGPNGSGKSTLVETIAGIVVPTAGRRVVSGAIAFVPQRTAVSDGLPLTVRDVVAVGTWGRLGRWRPARADTRAGVDDALRRLDITDLASASFATVSGGQRQRALLAQGLARRADLLLLDEPTTGLDAASAERIRAAMVDEARRGAAVVCVSHDPAVLAEADRIVRLEDGRRIA